MNCKEHWIPTALDAGVPGAYYFIVSSSVGEEVLTDAKAECRSQKAFARISSAQTKAEFTIMKEQLTRCKFDPSASVRAFAAHTCPPFGAACEWTVEAENTTSTILHGPLSVLTVKGAWHKLLVTCNKEGCPGYRRPDPDP